MWREKEAWSRASTFSLVDAVCEGLREQWQRGGVGIEQGRSFAVRRGDASWRGGQGEFRMEMGTGEGEREQEKDGMGTMILSTWQRRHALAHGGDFGSPRCASANEAKLGKWFDVLHLLEHHLVPR